MASLDFLGAAGTVTGSKFLLQVAGRRVLVDCGLFQGQKELRLRNWRPLPVAPSSIDKVVLTHGHIDHSGYLPRLVKQGFGGPVLATGATADLVAIMLRDSGHLQEEEARYHNRKGSSKHHPALPLYTEEDGIAAAERVEARPYGSRIALLDDVHVIFRRAGHILGSATVTVEVGEGEGVRRLVFSGDLGRTGHPILPAAAPIGDADYVVVESTYGDRLHSDEPIAEQLGRAVRHAVGRGGVLIVPAFAVGRTQELLYHLSGLERDGRVPPLPVYVDSPMAIDATEVYLAHPEDFTDGQARAIRRRIHPPEPSRFHLVRSAEESKKLNRLEGPAIIVSASGMATGGRVLHHLRNRLPDPRTTVLLVGYQAEGTRGWRLQRGEKTLRIFGESVPVRARVEEIHGLSAHADADGLMRWLKTADHPPRRLFVVHGEPKPAAALAERVREELGWEVSVPGYQESFELEL